jgi:hypothetical protein
MTLLRTTMILAAVMGALNLAGIVVVLAIAGAL